MHILALSTLFPTPKMPNHGIFVYNRLIAMSRIDDVKITIINPIPTSPIHKIMNRYAGQQSAPLKQTVSSTQDVDIYRPRYFALPGFQKDKEHKAMSMAVMKTLFDNDLVGKIKHVDIHWCYPDLPVGKMVADKLGVPCTVTLRGMETFYLEDKDNRSDIISQNIGAVDGVISLSQEMITQYQSMIRTKNPPATTLIRNGVDTATFTYTEKNTARAKLSLEKEDIILLGVGSLIKRKGFHHVAQSLAGLGKSFPDRTIAYYILGSSGLEGDFESELKSIIETVNTDNQNVKAVLYGKVNNHLLPFWYNAADIFCLSSFGEGSPNVLTEALSCGTPAVASDVGSVSDIMSSEENLGVVIPSQEQSKDDDACKVWQNAIEAIMHQEYDRKEQSSKMSKYTWDWCAQNALTFIHSTHK